MLLTSGAARRSSWSSRDKIHWGSARKWRPCREDERRVDDAPGPGRVAPFTTNWAIKRVGLRVDDALDGFVECDVGRLPLSRGAGLDEDSRAGSHRNRRPWVLRHRGR